MNKYGQYGAGAILVAIALSVPLGLGYWWGINNASTPDQPQPAISAPDSLELQDGVVNTLLAKTARKNGKIWFAIPTQAADVSVSKYPDHLVLASAKDCEFDVWSVTVVGGEPMFAQTRVTRHKAPPVPPVPPVPPTPVDPLTAAFQAGYDLDKDADRAKSLAFLQAIYPAMAATTPPPTVGATFTWMKSRVEAPPPTGLSLTQVQNLRKAIATELATAFSTSPAAAMDPANFRTELTKIGDKLKGVK